MSSAYGSSYGSPYGGNAYGGSPYGAPARAAGQGKGGGKDGGAAGTLRHAIRKGFLECEEALLEWEEAHRSSLSVIEAIVNAASRVKDFRDAPGDLGVISSTPGAERLLTAKLVQSIERLHGALQVTAKMFEGSCVRVEKAYEVVVKEQGELQGSCTLDEMWKGGYDGQPGVGEMLEWMQDLVNALRREASLRLTLVSRIGYDDDDGLRHAHELWDAGVFYQRDVFASRLDAVKVHCAL
jgi:hypothetical protein